MMVGNGLSRQASPIERRASRCRRGKGHSRNARSRGTATGDAVLCTNANEKYVRIENTDNYLCHFDRGTNGEAMGKKRKRKRKRTLSEVTRSMETLASIGWLQRGTHPITGETGYELTIEMAAKQLDFIIAHIDSLPAFKRRRDEVIALRTQLTRKYGI